MQGNFTAVRSGSVSSVGTSVLTGSATAAPQVGPSGPERSRGAFRPGYLVYDNRSGLTDDEYGGTALDGTNGNGSIVIHTRRKKENTASKDVTTARGDGGVEAPESDVASLNETEVADAPDALTLDQNYPNPFNPQATIR